MNASRGRRGWFRPRAGTVVLLAVTAIATVGVWRLNDQPRRRVKAVADAQRAGGFVMAFP